MSSSSSSSSSSSGSGGSSSNHHRFSFNKAQCIHLSIEAFLKESQSGNGRLSPIIVELQDWINQDITN